MFRWRRCSECGLSDWQRAKKLLLKFRQATRECSEIATLLAVKIRRGTWAPPPPLTGPRLLLTLNTSRKARKCSLFGCLDCFLCTCETLKIDLCSIPKRCRSLDPYNLLFCQCI